MSTFLRNFVQSACLSTLVVSAAHADQITIDCTQLGSRLDPVLLTGHYSESDSPASIAAVAPVAAGVSSFVPQIRHGVKIKLEPVLTDKELYTCFGKQAREIAWLRNSIDNQKARLREIDYENTFRLRFFQIAIIGCSALATILLAFGNSPRWSLIKTLAIIPTALATAFSTFSAFELSRTNRPHCQSGE
jgi:hypothetical protein